MFLVLVLISVTQNFKSAFQERYLSKSQECQYLFQEASGYVSKCSMGIFDFVTFIPNTDNLNPPSNGLNSKAWKPATQTNHNHLLLTFSQGTRKLTCLKAIQNLPVMIKLVTATARARLKSSPGPRASQGVKPISILGTSGCNSRISLPVIK